MDKLSVSLENCYGIKKLSYIFDFTKGNIVAIYARNGLMKTSFAKTMKKIQLGKKNEIRDEIFETAGVAEIKADDEDIAPDKVFVINSFESAYQADITPLLIDESTKTHLKDVLEEDLSSIVYARIFDDAVVKKILSGEFQNKIREYIEKSSELYASYGFLSKGKLTLPKLKNVQKTLKNENYFSQGNAIVLSGRESITDEAALTEQIVKIEDDLKGTPEFQAIEKLLSDAKGSALRDIIETNPQIIEWLDKNKLHELRTRLWISYLYKNRGLFDALLKKYKALSAEIDSVEIDDTPWKTALEIYNKRFSVPYEMRIENLKGAVIGESIPKIEFRFSDGERTVNMSRDKLDELNTLSQGEKRALYLLNIIFEVEEIKQRGKDVVFIVDDIADSFDYKNKYAIVEYLYEIAQDDRFSMIILSHNFDFYRTISSRLGLSRKIVCVQVKIEQALY